MRYLVRLGILVLVVRILADIATPFLPGAFGLDPTSVLAAEVKPDDASAFTPAVRSGPPEWADGAYVARQREEPRPAPYARPSCLRIVHLPELGSSPESEDD